MTAQMQQTVEHLAGPQNGARRTMAGLAASALSVLPLSETFTDWAWLPPVWIGMFLAIGPAALLRTRWAPRGIHLLPGLALALIYLTARFVPHHAWGGVIPLRGAWLDVAAMNSQFRDTIRDGSAPLQSTEPVRMGFATMAIPIARAEIEYAEQLAKTLGMTAVDTEITPPPTPDYTPFATKLKDANPNWVYSWSPWVSQVRTFEALRRLGWNGRYITWAHLNAEEELARIKDGTFYVFGTNALFQENLPIHAEIRATTQRANLKYPPTYLAEGFIAGLVAESVLKATAWPPTPAKVLAAMNNVKVDLKGLRGGPLEWTADNHFRTTQYYRVWHWDPAKQAIIQIQDWQAIGVKR